MRQSVHASATWSGATANATLLPLDVAVIPANTIAAPVAPPTPIGRSGQGFRTAFINGIASTIPDTNRPPDNTLVSGPEYDSVDTSVSATAIHATSMHASTERLTAHLILLPRGSKQAKAVP